LPRIPAKIVSARTLSGTKAEANVTAAGIEIRVPEAGRDLLDTVVALALDSDAARLPAVDVR
jgi:hypothetical protein